MPAEAQQRVEIEGGRCGGYIENREAHNANPSNQPNVHGKLIAKVEVEQRAGIKVEPERRGEAHITSHRE